MTKQELIEQGFKYIATQNCEQKTEVWARFTGWEDAIQYWYYFPEIDQTNPGNVNVISFVSQLGLFEIMADKMRGDFLKNDVKYDSNCIWESVKEEGTNQSWMIDGMQRIEESINIDNPSQRNYTHWIVDDLQKITKAREDFINGEFNCGLKGDKNEPSTL